MKPFALFLVLLAASTLSAEEWQIDTGHSAAQFAVRHLMVSTVRGHFGKLTGTVKYDPAKPQEASVYAEVDASTIDTREPKRDADLKGEDFFNVAKYPKITFQSTKIERIGDGKFRMAGNFTMRGVTRPVVFDVEGMLPPIKDQRGIWKTGATATGKISRKEFGMTWNPVLEAGGVTVSDEVTITIDVELRQRGS
jgi:polyisoprenoid-binding protein YceI